MRSGGIASLEPALRADDRADHTIRPLTFQRGFTDNPGGSVVVSWGRTRVMCTAMIEDGVPPWLLGSGRGWLTAEYSMLPGATPRRKARDSARGRVDGRAAEIQRLVGRSLRAAVDLTNIPGKTAWVDCDVLQADGGTRTAAINGAWIALHDAVESALRGGLIGRSPLVRRVAAVSVGVVDGAPLADLCAAEDQAAEVDMNVVMTGDGEFIEVQGSAEKGAFPESTLVRLLALAKGGVQQVLEAQSAALEGPR